MTSFACVPVGRLMLSDEALLAVPLLLVAEPRYPMMYAPGQVSATSHSPAAGRHTAPGLPGKCWQLVLVPVQVSATSHSPAPARQTVAALPAGCWQLVLVPSHWSRVQGLPSSVQAVPLAFRGPSAGHVALEPVQVSGRSHSPAAARQVFVLLAKVQLFLQHEPAAPFNALPRSQSSPDSTVPLPQVQGASVNVVSAVWPEERPAAVSVNVTPMSKTSTVKSVFVKSPFESA